MSNETSPPAAKLSAWFLEGIDPMPAVVEQTTLSEDTIEREFPNYVVRLSPRRKGMKRKHILAICNGTLPRRSG